MTTALGGCSSLNSVRDTVVAAVISAASRVPIRAIFATVIDSPSPPLSGRPRDADLDFPVPMMPPQCPTWQPCRMCRER
jgi:hypothetical protein